MYSIWYSMFSKVHNCACNWSNLVPYTHSPHSEENVYKMHSLTLLVFSRLGFLQRPVHIPHPLVLSPYLVDCLFLPPWSIECPTKQGTTVTP